MRWVAILAVVAVLLMFWGGWLYFQNTDTTSEVILDKEEVQQDTEKAVEEGKQVMEGAAEGMKRFGEEVEETFSDEQPRDEEAPAEEPTSP